MSGTARPGTLGELIRRDEQYLRTGLTDNDTRLIWRAMQLAPNLETCRAMLQGHPVPKSALDPEWLARFGL